VIKLIAMVSPSPDFGRIQTGKDLYNWFSKDPDKYNAFWGTVGFKKEPSLYLISYSGIVALLNPSTTWFPGNLSDLYVTVHYFVDLDITARPTTH